MPVAWLTGIALGVVTAVVVLAFRAANLRVHDDVAAAHAAEILERRVAALLHELLHALDQVLDHGRADRAIEHRRGADLHRAAAEQHVVERVREGADAADAGERLVGKRLGQLRHLGERLRQDRRTAKAAARHQAVDVHLEVERLRIDQRQRRERVRRHDRIGAAVKRRAGLFGDLGGRRRQLRPHRDLRHFLHDLGDDRHLRLILAEVRAHVLAIHVRARQVQLERIGAGVLAGLREHPASARAPCRCPSPP